MVQQIQLLGNPRHRLNLHDLDTSHRISLVACHLAFQISTQIKTFLGITIVMLLNLYNLRNK
jgi:hypothetical protein